MEGEFGFASAFDDPLPKVEPPEDPLGGTVSPSEEDVTVPTSQRTVTGVPVPTTQIGPGTTPGVQIVNLSDLLQRPTQQVPTTSNNQATDSNSSKSLNITVPGGQVINIPLNQLQRALVSAPGREPISNISTSVFPLSSGKKAPNQPNQLRPEIVHGDPMAIQIKDEPEDPSSNAGCEGPQMTNISISALNAAQSLTKPGSRAPVVRPISLPGGHLVPIPINLLRGGSSNISISLPTSQSANTDQSMMPSHTPVGQTTTVPSSASSGTINQSGPVSTPPAISSLLPGTNMVVVLTPDGQLITRPVTLTVASSLHNAVESTSLTSNSQEKSMPVARTIRYSKSSSMIALKNQTAKMSNASKLTVSHKTPATAHTIHSSHPSRQPDHNPIKNIPPLHWTVTPSAALNPNSKATWPPPLSTRRKIKPKIQLPLSGSWTNPSPPSPTAQFSGSWTNPNLPSVSPRELLHKNTEQHPWQHSMASPEPERDPLEGPVQDIILPKNDVTVGKFVKMNSYGSNSILRETLEKGPVKCTKSTQCSSFSTKVAYLEPPELKRPLLTPVVRGIGIGVQAKCIVYNVYKYFEQMKARYKMLSKVGVATESATGVKFTTVKRIMREARNTCNGNDPSSMPTFKSPTRRRARVKLVVSNMHIDTALRRHIHEHILEKNDSPGLQYLQTVCSSDGLRTGYMSKNFIRLRIKKLGFITVRTNRRLIHVEGASIRAWRYRYLKQLKSCMEEKKNIVFTFVVNLREIKQSETNWEVLESCNEELLKRRPGENRVLTVFHAANENGFIDGGFFINDAVINTLNVADEMWYSEWLELRVLRKIPEGSVVVLAHDKYHEMADSKWKPNAGSSKKEVVDWLKSRAVDDIDETLPKCVLLENVSRFPVEQKYSIDPLVETYGHTAVHLPPSQKDLNPLEYVWEDIRTKFSNMGKLKTPKDSLANEFSSAEHVLKKAWKQVKRCEDAYRKNDPLLDDAQEAAIRKLGGLWTSPNNDPLPDETVEDLDVDLGSGDSDTNSSDSQSKSVSSSNSDSNLDSELELSSDSESNKSAISSSEDSEDEVPLSERISGSKRRKIK